TAVPLNLPSSATIDLPTELAGTGAFATAPTIVIPATGLTSMVVDAGAFAGNATCLSDLGGPCRIYKFVLAGTRTFSISATWDALGDLGLYLYSAAATQLPWTGGIFACDAHGNGAASQPEACSVTLVAGTYFIANDTFTAFYGPPDNVDPTFVRFDLTGQ
ncbi:MAG TPA: hypothetical protein VGP80_10980, partial [Gemmatimonadales bacterium]|nr:hypothetical protein [Gemmatimonadales bacterium]